MSKTITLSVPDEIAAAMQRHPEINYSELARERITEYLSAFNQKEEFNPSQFLILKNLIFSRQKVTEIHHLVEKNRATMRNLDWTDSVFDLDMLESLANFLHRFAKEHPFEDGNKRTAFVCVDSFLRLNRLKLKVKAEKGKTTEDEKFFWQNANQEKSQAQARDFLKSHLVSAKKPKSVNQAITESIADNKQLLENLSA